VKKLFNLFLTPFLVFRVLLFGSLIVALLLLATQTYAFQPTLGLWTKIPLNGVTEGGFSGTPTSIAVDPTDHNTLYGGADQHIYKSTDGGDNWIPIENIGGGGIAIDPQNTQNIFVANIHMNETMKVVKSINGGSTWTDISNNFPVGTNGYDMVIDPINSQIMLVAVYGNAGLERTADGGRTWTYMGGNDAYHVVFAPSNHNVLYSGAGQTGFIKSTDDGATWIQTTQPPTGGVRGIAINPYNSDIVYTAGGTGGIYKSIDGGITWTYLSSGPRYEVGQPLIADPIKTDTVYAADLKGTNGVVVSTDGGATWSSMNTGLPGVSIVVLYIPPSNPCILYALTSGGVFAYGLCNPNQPPLINPLSNSTLNEGSTYSANGSFTDPDSSSWTGTVDYGDGTGVNPIPSSDIDQTNHTFALHHVYQDEGATGQYTISVIITDNQGASSQPTTATVTVNNAPFTVSPITGPTSSTPLGTGITVSATFSDPGVLDTHTASWNWGDIINGNPDITPGTVTESNGSGTVGPDSHTYAQAGVYQVTVTVTDDDGVPVTSAPFQYVVIYNPTGGFLTGEGKYQSLAGWDTQNTGATGEVKLGISAQYQTGNTVPTGQSKINFKVGNLSFSGATFQWLVVNGSKATVLGSGTINGIGNYTILLSGIDGSQTNGQSLVRVKITDNSNNNIVIYDTQTGAADTADPTTPLTQGSIKVH